MALWHFQSEINCFIVVVIDVLNICPSPPAKVICIRLERDRGRSTRLQCLLQCLFKMQMLQTLVEDIGLSTEPE